MSDNEEEEQQRRRSCTVIMTNSNVTTTTTTTSDQKDAEPGVRRTGSMRRRLSKQNATIEEPANNPNSSASDSEPPIREEEEDEVARPALQRVNAIVGDDDTKLRPPGMLAKHASWSASKSLSRESNGTEFSDRSGTDLRQFIRRTMHKSEEDREQLLYFERIMIELVENSEAQSQKFELPSSYHRMLLHRCAAWFGLDHNVTNRHTEIVINKSEKTKIPEDKFSDFIVNNEYMEGKFTRHSSMNSPRREYGSQASLSNDHILTRRAQSFDIYSTSSPQPPATIHHPPQMHHQMRQLSLQCSTPPPPSHYTNAAPMSGGGHGHGHPRMWAAQRSFDCSPQHHNPMMMRKAESFGNMGGIAAAANHTPSVMVHHYHHCYEEPTIYHHHECSPSYYATPPQTYPVHPPPQATVYYPIPYATHFIQPELIVNDPEPFPPVEQFVVDQGYTSKHQAQTASSFIKASIDGGYGSMNQEAETSSSSRESESTKD